MAISVSQKGFVRYFTDPGIAYHVFMVFFPVVMAIAMYFLYQSYQTYKERLYGKGILYLLIATIIASIGGGANFLVSYNIITPYLVPFGTYALILYAAVVAYIILRYQWFDIIVVIRKTLVFAGLFGFVFAVIVTVALFTQEFIAQYIPNSRYLALAISAAIIVLLHQPVYSFLVNITNKFLFQRKYDPRKVLKDFADEALTILNLDKLSKATVDTLVKNLYINNCTILLLGRDALGFEIYDSFGIVDEDIFFSADSKLANIFKVNKLPLLYESYDKSLQAPEEVKADMDKIQSQLCIPMIIHSEIVGILSLGTKKSDQPYNAEDIDILTTLVKTLSIAISNARLFMEAAQYEKLATVGTIASAINHEVCNPLNSVSVLMQTYILGGQDKKSANKEVVQEHDKASDIMQKTLDQINKVIGITGKLSSFAKPSKVVSSKPVDISQVVEDSLEVLKYKLKSTDIAIEKNIPSGLPKIIADPDQMQQILYNLIRNAAQSIEGKGTVTVLAKEENEKVKIEIADTGCGIAEEKIGKIFDPFFTTKVDGSGYGLSVVRELVLRNKGEINVKSKIKEGTTFYLEFPKA